MQGTAEAATQGTTETSTATGVDGAAEGGSATSAGHDEIVWNRWPVWLASAYIELCAFLRVYGWYVIAVAIAVYLAWPSVAAWRRSVENERHRRSVYSQAYHEKAASVYERRQEELRKAAEEAIRKKEEEEKSDKSSEKKIAEIDERAKRLGFRPRGRGRRLND